MNALYVTCINMIFSLMFAITEYKLTKNVVLIKDLFYVDSIVSIVCMNDTNFFSKSLTLFSLVLFISIIS